MPKLTSLLPSKWTTQGKSTLVPSEANKDVGPSPDGVHSAPNEREQSRPQIAERTDKYGLFPFHAEDTATGGAFEMFSAANVGKIWPIDIVALHGVTGDAYKTWEHEDGALWLRDFLLPDFPGSRVFSYGYDPDIFFSWGTGNLETFARTMLQAVKQSRVGLENRPLIFICHSMGGLVVKKAIIYAILKQALYEDIRSSCKGVVFLGTPHRGSLQTGWPLLVANIANVATMDTSRLMGKARTDLLEILQREAPVLEQLAREFADQPRNIKIASFIEQDITPPAKDRIVDGVTGIMNSVGEEVIDMQGCDHKSICRFPSRTNNYKLIQAIIRAWATEAFRTPRHSGEASNEQANQRALHSANQLECLRSLSFPEMNWRKLDLSDKASTNTCKWVFEHSVYREWSASPQGPLWIKGKPGSGKSTLMQVITQQFRETVPHHGFVLLTFFFNAFGREPLEKSTAGMYRSLLHQLLEQDPPSCDDFRTVYEKRKQSQQSGKGKVAGWHDKEQNQLKALFTQALEKIAARGTKIAIFIDALDEAVQGSAQDVITYVYRLDERLRQSEPRTRICISCRHFPIYAADNRHEILMEKHNEGDVRNFVRTEFAEKGILRREFLRSSGTLAALEDEIVKRACGVFLWASLITPVIIRQLNVATPLATILDSLDQAPTRLGEIYSDIIRDVIHQDLRTDSYRLMSWASRNNEPLPLVSIAISVHFTAGYAISSTDLDLSEEAKDILEIRVGTFSGGLLEVKLESADRSAYFIHPTVKTFLKDEGLRLLYRLQGTEPTYEDMMQEIEATTTGQSPQSHVPSLRSRYNAAIPGFPLDVVEVYRTQAPARIDVVGRGNMAETTPGTTTPMSETEFIEGPIDAHETREDEKHPKSTAQWFERLSSLTHTFLEARDPSKERVKVAIIDTGIETSHVLLRKFKDQIRQTKSWVGGKGDEDGWGIGTHAAALIFSIAPTVEIYAARVAKDPSIAINPEHVAQAIIWAIDRKVNIISIAPSIDQCIPAIETAIHDATEEGIIVLTAASGGGSPEVGFPARLEGVIPVYSADASGNPSIFNPFLGGADKRLTFLGEDVESAWPMAHEEGPKKSLSGLSVATTVAAGVAALILDFSRQPEGRIEPVTQRLLHTPEGMRTIFRYLSSGRGAHGRSSPCYPRMSFFGRAYHDNGERRRVIGEEEEEEGKQCRD